MQHEKKIISLLKKPEHIKQLIKEWGLELFFHFLSINIAKGQGEVEGLITLSKYLRDTRFLPLLYHILFHYNLNYNQIDRIEQEIVFLGGSWPYSWKDTATSPMIYIPAGFFVMGSNKGTQREAPARKLYLPGFFIDKYPVTFIEFKSFITKTNYKTHSGWEKHYSQERLHCPVVSISWVEARDFCKYLGKRLPREAEWEKAARGSRGYTWPWGNQWEEGKANTLEMKLGTTLQRGSFPQGASPYGVEEMAGGVWEWVWDSLSPYHKEIKIAKGGSYLYSKDFARSSYRFLGSQWGWERDLGFRCVWSAESK